MEKRLTVRISQEMANKLDEKCEEFKVNYSDVIRQVLGEFLKVTPELKKKPNILEDRAVD